MKMNTDDTILHMKNITKSFGVNKVLSDVDFELKKGEVHALLGENGAGKSTLLNILTGTLKCDQGQLFLSDNQIEIKSVIAARDYGIIRVHQELQVVPQMTVGQNIFLGNEPKTKIGSLDYKEIHRKSSELLERLDADFSSKDILADLSTAQMQMVEISKALLQNFSVLALDEPTSSLTNNEIEKLLTTINQLRSEGKSIIYVSHRLQEVFSIADRATVLRDGKLIGTVNIPDITRSDLIKMMIGRDISEQRFNETSHAKPDEALRVENLSGKGFKDVNFSIKKGEVVGFAGLVGAGRTELMRALFGIDPHTKGNIFVNGNKTNIKNPEDAKDQGIMLIPEDRKLQGMVGILQNKTNITMSSLEQHKKFGILNHRSIRDNAKQLSETLQIMPSDVDMVTKSLSGGNQQKVVIARILNVDPDIFILDEPTRGIDINVKFEIYKLMRSFAEKGKAVIMVSSELPEIISLSDRVIVMHEGEIKGELTSDELTEESIMTLAMGGVKS